MRWEELYDGGMRLTNEQCRRWLNHHYSLPYRAGTGVRARFLLDGQLNDEGIRPVLDTIEGWRVRKGLVSSGRQTFVRVQSMNPQTPYAIGRAVLTNPHSWYLIGGVVTVGGLLFSPPSGWIWPIMFYGTLLLTLYILQTSIREEIDPPVIDRLYEPSPEEFRSIMQQQPDEVRMTLPSDD